MKKLYESLSLDDFLILRKICKHSITWKYYGTETDQCIFCGSFEIKPGDRVVR